MPFYQWLAIELSLIALLSFGWSFENRLAGYSAFIGGLIYVIPNAYFAHRMFRFEGARQARLVVGNMFRAESIKLALTAVFFAAVFILIEPIHVSALLFTFAVMVALSPLLRWFIRPQPQR
ncbi:ATP synthase subunit I [Marinobacter sp. CHS3-4]|uniref:ATP synthase subunit I n=1 Tax=Marinobacter sp. CHS3-4 TaxID=3045174 RepID=UPI0024B584EA|nr:ATP synthase subunit I [Marinobacter sp. CHS3-4]MDI9243803.1 ATP synthase subunit I [Marinobacter sp. CHS3-4]